MHRHCCLMACATFLAACSPAKEPAPGTVITLDARTSRIVPSTNAVYKLAQGVVYKPFETGPSSLELSIAWKAANEFVYRTRLRTTLELPASGVARNDSGTYSVSFSPRSGTSETVVIVNAQDRTITLQPRP